MYFCAAGTISSFHISRRFARPASIEAITESAHIFLVMRFLFGLLIGLFIGLQSGGASIPYPK